MARKKETTITLTDEEQQQIQHLLTQYHDLARRLKPDADIASTVSTLDELLALSPTAQLAMLKELGKEQNSDAANVLLAINTVSQDKEVRKEARRSLLRLEGVSVQPTWQAPATRTSVVEVKVENPKRFWKAYVTPSREQGEVILTLHWELGYDYSDVQTFMFLLDFWRQGVNGFEAETLGKRRTQEKIEERKAQIDGSMVECSLAEAKRLLEEALSVNAWRSTPLPQQYRQFESTLSKRVFQAQDLGQDRGRTFLYPEMEAQEVALNFVGAWAMGDYGLTYDLLSHDSTLLKDLTRDQWIEQHRQWASEARPSRLELSFVHEHENKQSGLWLPSHATAGQSNTKEIEISWSLEISETMLSGTLAEMPMGTAVNRETGRRWFWTLFKVVRSHNEWRIQRINDEGARIQGLPIEEIQKQVREHEKRYEELNKRQQAQPNPEEMQAILDELVRDASQDLHYQDALIALLSLDRQPYEVALGRAMMLGNPERAMVYLQRLVQRFPENLEEMLHTLASTYVTYAYSQRIQDMPERQRHFLDMAEATLHEAGELHHSVTNHILLAELYTSQERNDEAEAELHRARELKPNRDEESSIEANLGALALRREQMAEALTHFERASQLKPDMPGIWFNLGFTHRLLGHFDAAETHYKRAIEQNPQDIRAYSELIAVYMNRPDQQAARRTVERGLAANPTSAHLLALHASVLHVLGDERTARRQLDLAMRIDPNLDVVQAAYQQLQKKK
ncbi:tetratricopeptide repeat protein [Ktedonospora formicarum]|uniref:Tetratricopeptide repeat protein n=1 Tax=Ktedonospora formicarum TaxID=2778364 RepID=A0A8J3MSW8_9CHLR|nr:tetratricopeptide repeat protein [Ktedonospora formicarum]GHO45281.1 hypothetical protein KSX_34440 [Ktedonospora formicarum]